MLLSGIPTSLTKSSNLSSGNTFPHSRHRSPDLPADDRPVNCSGMTSTGSPSPTRPGLSLMGTRQTQRCNDDWCASSSATVANACSFPGWLQLGGRLQTCSRSGDGARWYFAAGGGDNERDAERIEPAELELEPELERARLRSIGLNKRQKTQTCHPGQEWTPPPGGCHKQDTAESPLAGHHRRHDCHHSTANTQLYASALV